MLSRWIVTLVLLLTTSQGLAKGEIWQLDIKGAIGPATADYLVRGLDQASTANAYLILIQLDTPGGLDKSMRQIIKALLASNTPVACFVGPSGARAASAGTYILYACHVAAMAPATNLGAATPVQIGSPSMPKPPNDKNDKVPEKTAMEKKVINDAIAYIEGLARLRDRNVEWAKLAVSEGASLDAEQALKQNVIDLMATDIPDLLKKLDGYRLTMGTEQIKLNTGNLPIKSYQPDWRNEFLATITNPNIAYLLMLAGIYGLLFEFSNPGMGLPGITGGICLLIALYAFQVLPISYAGLGLIILGIALMVAEAFAPSFGVLGLGGIVAFVIGSIILMDTTLPAYQIAIPLIAALAITSAMLLVILLRLLVKSRQQVLVSGLQHLVGQTAKIECLHNNVAMVRLDGELWQTSCQDSLTPNDPVIVDEADGVVLQVRKLKEDGHDI